MIRTSLETAEFPENKPQSFRNAQTRGTWWSTRGQEFSRVGHEIRREGHAWTSAHLRRSTRGTSSPARDLRCPGVRHEGSRDDHASAMQGTRWARRAPRTPDEEIEVSMRALGTCSDAGARTSAEVARCQRENRGARGDVGERPGADAGRHEEASSHRGFGECRRGVRSCRREAHGRCGGAHLGHRAAVVKCGGAGACPREAVACRDEARPSRRRARDREGRNRALGREGAFRSSGACERRRGARLPPGRVCVCCPGVVGRPSRALNLALESWHGTPADEVLLAPNVLSIRHWDRLMRGALYAATPRLDWAQTPRTAGLFGACADLLT